MGSSLVDWKYCSCYFVLAFGLSTLGMTEAFTEFLYRLGFFDKLYNIYQFTSSFSKSDPFVISEY